MSLFRPRTAWLAATVFVVAPVVAPAQIGNGRLAGTITDDRGRPVKGATIVAENETYFPKSFSSATDAKGKFSILGLRSTTYKITILADGFERVTVTMPVRAGQPNPPVDVRLVPKLEPAPPPLLARVDAAKLQQDLDSAAALATGGRLDDAIVAYRRILKEVPALTSVNVQLGYLHETQGDRAAAIAAYELALKGDPSSTLARDALARLRTK